MSEPTINDAAAAFFAEAGSVSDSINDNAYKYFVAGGGAPPADSVGTAQLQDNSVTSAKIVDLTIVAGDIANATITGGKIASSTINSSNLNVNSVITTKILDANVTLAKLAAASVDQSKIAGTARLLLTQAGAIADIGAAPSQADFNGLLAALRTAGVIAP